MPRKKDFQKNGYALLFLQIVSFVTAAWLLLLYIALSFTLRYNQKTATADIEERLMSSAQSLSQSDMVRSAIENMKCSDELMQYLDGVLECSDVPSIISICNFQSIRVYHLKHERIGQEFVGGDQYAALEGESYFSDAEGTMGMQHRAFCPVYGSDGQVIGFVMTSSTLGRISSMRSEIVDFYMRLALALMAATFAMAILLSAFLYYRSGGFSIEYLADTYLTQSEILDSLNDGIISVNGDGNIQFSNLAAEKMLGKSRELLRGEELDKILLGENGESLLTATGDPAQTSNPNILSSVHNYGERSGYKGYSIILTDRSEALREAEQLNGTRHIISALRANTHEFMNKQQVVYGLVQMGRNDEALSYMDKLSTDMSPSVGMVLQLIQNPNVAALLIGKLSNMKERNITLSILPNSDLPRHSRFLTSDELVTIIGNLVENAMEAINARVDAGPRVIDLQLTETESELLIAISDTGIGMKRELIGNLFTMGFSTKADSGRGVGLHLIRGILDKNGGNIEVDSEPGEGSSFLLLFTRLRENYF